MTTVTLEQAQSTLSDLVHKLDRGHEVVITENDQPVARLIVTRHAMPNAPRRLGTLKGTVLSVSPDFDAPLAEFREYME